MPIDYVRDDTRRRIIMTVTDPIGPDDVIAATERQAADGTWSYGLLYDARLSSSRPPKPSTNEALATLVRDLSAVYGRRGPVAVVARTAGVIGATHFHTVRTSREEPVEAFWDKEEAEQWLTQRQARQ